MKIGIDYSVSSFIIYNKKTYVMAIDGKPKPLIKGATLRNRKNELFLQEFIATCIRNILASNYDACVVEYEYWKLMLESRVVEAKHIMQKQSLKTTLEEYVSKVAAGDRNKDAIYEVALSDKEIRYEKGDPVYIYVADGEAKKKFELAKSIRKFEYDYKIQHYVKRLTETAKTILLPIFGIDKFNEMFAEHKIKLYKKDLDRIKQTIDKDEDNE